MRMAKILEVAENYPLIDKMMQFVYNLLSESCNQVQNIAVEKEMRNDNTKSMPITACVEDWIEGTKQFLLHCKLFDHLVCS